MTVYVDDAGIKATVLDGRTGQSYASRWCHLFSSEIDQTELHEFAATIGLKREWFQAGRDLLERSKHDPVGDHYDLTVGKRRQAVTAGAVSVDRDRAVELWRAKRDLVRQGRGGGTQ